MGRSLCQLSFGNILLNKREKVERRRKFTSQTSITERIKNKDKKIHKNFKVMIRRLMTKSKK